MLVGDRFERDGKYYEVTRVMSNGNYGFKEVEKEVATAPKPVFNPTFEEEVKEVEEKKATVKRGKKKV